MTPKQGEPCKSSNQVYFGVLKLVQGGDVKAMERRLDDLATKASVTGRSDALEHIWWPMRDAREVLTEALRMELRYEWV